MRFAYVLTNDQGTAEELVQEAFVRAFSRLQHLRSPDAFYGYLRSTLVNLARDRFRKRRSEQAFLEQQRGMSAHTEPPPDTRLAMEDALLDLPYRQRAVLILRYFEDLSERQTAEVLKCSVGAVKSLARRGLLSLREGFEVPDAQQ